MKSRYILLIIFLILTAVAPAFSQECENSLPDNAQWKAQTTGSASMAPGNAKGLTITKAGPGEYKVSDLSAGFFKANGVPYEIEVEIRIDCDATVEPMQFESDFGHGTIQSGHWDPESKTLTILWSIPKNKLDEKSVFRLQ